MNKSKIYVKGTSGFKPVVKEKLGDTWMHNERNTNIDTIMLLLTAETQLDALRAAVGEELIAEYNLQFLTGLDENDTMELAKLQGSAAPLRMSIWTGKHSNIRARETQMPQRDPVVPVF